ncbi:MAG: hypothetical protein DRI65_06005 [Chloroflexota bacterium]|nr:MAG: hypothetical protein DRI65_06005 [Chloroflexota bacterium]HDD62027.1 hypothetical protein [Chloroflexota bacterium]
MIKNISKWLNKISKTWVMILTVAAMALFMITVLPDQAASAEQNAGGSISPDTSFFYAPEDLLQAAEEYGAGGRLAYIQARWTFDLVFPLVYMVFLVTGISWFHQNLENQTEWIGYTNLLPVAAGLFDYLENTGASLVMGLYPAQVTGLALLTTIFSGVKWLLIAGSFLAYFGLAGAALFQWVRGKIR